MHADLNWTKQRIDEMDAILHRCLLGVGIPNRWLMVKSSGRLPGEVSSAEDRAGDRARCRLRPPHSDSCCGNIVGAAPRLQLVAPDWERAQRRFEENWRGQHAEPRLRVFSARLVPWLFAAKTTAAGLLVLLIAFTFNLDDPQWGLLTVFIVAQPQKDGLVLAKSFYRMIGTCIGAAGALLLVGLFAQERVLFLGALAIWVGLCTFGSQYARNWAAYAFVLSGYTVAIVGIPGALDPGNAFYIAVARVTEISLGIMVTATVSHIVLPMSLATPLRQAIASARTELADYLAVLLGLRDSAALRVKLLGRAVSIENLGDSAIFEDRAIRERAYLLRQLAVGLIDVINASQLLSRWIAALDRSRTEAGPQIAELMADTALVVKAWCTGDIDAVGLGARLRQVEIRLLSVQQLSGERTISCGTPLHCVAISDALRELFAAMVAYAKADEAFASGAPPPQTRTKFARANDFAGALWTGLRAAVAVIVMSCFWIAVNWPHGSTATVLVAVAVARVATMGRAVPLAIAGTLIFSLSTIPAFIIVDVLLPLASGFPMFALAVAPMLFLCAFLMAHERTMIIGYLSALLFASVAMFQNRMVYDPIGLLNTSIAAIVVAAVTLVLWATMAPETSESARRRFIRTAHKLLADVGRARQPIGHATFETAMAEALDRLRGAARLDQPADVATLDEGTALLIAGRAALRLRQDRHSAAASLASELCAAAASRAWRRFECIRDKVRAEAKQGLLEVHDPALGAQAQAAAGHVASLMTIADELEQARPLLAGAPETVMVPDAA